MESARKDKKKTKLNGHENVADFMLLFFFYSVKSQNVITARWIWCFFFDSRVLSGWRFLNRIDTHTVQYVMVEVSIWLRFYVSINVFVCFLTPDFLPDFVYLFTFFYSIFSTYNFGVFCSVFFYRLWLLFINVVYHGQTLRLACAICWLVLNVVQRWYETRRLNRSENSARMHENTLWPTDC